MSKSLSETAISQYYSLAPTPLTMYYSNCNSITWFWQMRAWITKFRPSRTQTYFCNIHENYKRFTLQNAYTSSVDLIWCKHGNWNIHRLECCQFYILEIGVGDQVNTPRHKWYFGVEGEEITTGCTKQTNRESRFESYDRKQITEKLWILINWGYCLFDIDVR